MAASRAYLAGLQLPAFPSAPCDFGKQRKTAGHEIDPRKDSPDDIHPDDAGTQERPAEPPEKLRIEALLPVRLSVLRIGGHRGSLGFPSAHGERAHAARHRQGLARERFDDSVMDELDGFHRHLGFLARIE